MMCDFERGIEVASAERESFNRCDEDERLKRIDTGIEPQSDRDRDRKRQVKHGGKNEREARRDLLLEHKELHAVCDVEADISQRRQNRQEDHGRNPGGSARRIHALSPGLRGWPALLRGACSQNIVSAELVAP